MKAHDCPRGGSHGHCLWAAVGGRINLVRAPLGGVLVLVRRCFLATGVNFALSVRGAPPPILIMKLGVITTGAARGQHEVT